MTESKMTRDRVSQICKDKGFYTTPELNEKLYLHFFGFNKIENLESFWNCKVLWLENNSIGAIENLECLPRLTSLFIQNNAIKTLVREFNPSQEKSETEKQLLVQQQSRWVYLRDHPIRKAMTEEKQAQYIDPTLECISQPLCDVEDSPPGDLKFPLISSTPTNWPLPPTAVLTCGTLPSLTVLNVSHNFFTSVAGLSASFPNLERFIAAHNSLTQVESEIKALRNLTVLDISFNRIGEDEDETKAIDQVSYLGPSSDCEKVFLHTLGALPMLSSFIFTGNPLIRRIRNYRKKLIHFNKSLKYIDEYPVFEDERVTSEAYAEGGREAETHAKRKLKETEETLRSENMKRFDALVAGNARGAGDDDVFDDVFIPQQNHAFECQSAENS